jgi:hypothetical protein
VTAGKRAGARFEQQVVDYLATHGFPYAERRVMGGTRDRGDIAGVIGWTLEAKATRELDLAGAMDEVATEARHAGTRWYAAILKRRRKPIALAYVVLPLHLFTDLLREDHP